MTRSLLALAAMAVIAAAAGAVMLGHRSKAPGAAAPATVVETAALLPGEIKLRHIRQEAELCVPTAAAMVLDYYGEPKAPRLLKTLAGGKPYDPKAVFTDFTITPYRDILRAVSTLGYQWAEQTFPNTQAGFRRGVGEIEAALAAGRPVLADVTLAEGIGHTFVITGADAAKQSLVVVDPDQPAPGRRVIGYAAFEKSWNEGAYGGDFRALIVTRRKWD